MTRQFSDNGPLLLVLQGGNWIINIKNGVRQWRAETEVSLWTRSDTGQANRSPQTTILPAVRVPSNCQRDFNLLAFDPDGDEVKCWFAAGSECHTCTLPSVLNVSSSCSLSFSPTSSSNEGPYAVQLVMRDFPKQTVTLNQTITATPNTSLSEIPVQFVLKVDPVVPSCTEGLYLPRFLPPTPANRAQLYTPVNQTLEISINAEANNSMISELLFSGPYNVNQTTSGAGQFVLRWTPSEDQDGESYPMCFVAQAVNNLTKYHSELRCVTVSVGNGSTANIQSTAAPLNATTIINSTNTQITTATTVNETTTQNTTTPSTAAINATTAAINATLPTTAALNATLSPPVINFNQSEYDE
ncbi:uncharacterized protein ABDE67_020488 [Symphorus nematophorus]